MHEQMCLRQNLQYVMSTGHCPVEMSFFEIVVVCTQDHKDLLVSYGFVPSESSPLKKLSGSGYDTVETDFPVGCRATFISVRVNSITFLPTVDAGIFEVLDDNEWFNDSVLSTFVDMLQRGMPESSSDGSRIMEPPSTVHTQGKLSWCIDWGEVCILDPQNVKTIVRVHKSKDFTSTLHMMTKKCKFRTVK